MSLKDELEEYVKKTHRGAWDRREGRKVPETPDIALANQAVVIDGAVLYADLAESTGLVKGYKDWFAAEVYKNYLYCAARIIRAHGGVITAYDGDRVMAVYVGDTRRDDAVKTALKINWSVKYILQPAIESRYPKDNYVLKQKVGVDSSSLFVARTGIRGSNDLVWVGNAANNAAKMAALDSNFPTYITKNVYENLSDSTKLSKNGEGMWRNHSTSLGYQVYGSTYWWPLA
ncbi:adenylate/guanylate cyclase domain-containing protein [Nocardiopsis sp. NRRL B-16309]|uniref:adenylate/guanylate cyclase domain-containing protein n=1 Tax=Nocardiopsis sp. NRRL B-16309 TaxID=1519494 RepID=UPI0009EA11E6|nr:adenylate/guanylate cyclase domain-containing protein [Nocardiopsis sp. NRRL B-16309]